MIEHLATTARYGFLLLIFKPHKTKYLSWIELRNYVLLLFLFRIRSSLIENKKGVQKDEDSDKKLVLFDGNTKERGRVKIRTNLNDDT